MHPRPVPRGRILAFEGSRKVYWFEGGFSDYEENHKKRVGISCAALEVQEAGAGVEYADI